MKRFFFLFFLFVLHSCLLSQGFLRRQNTEIVNDNGPVLLRGMGLGGWMLQEGYMMKTSSFANAQYQIKAKIEALVGSQNTQAFYDAWLENYMQKVDLDSLKAWGFNSVRLAMHYNLYTLPIEEEPVSGEHTWLERGFELTDRLLNWCAENEMYLILDLHAAPGGQGYESGISDYDPSKPSLWESAENRAKTVALWKKLAERYADELWMGGYDLINETNWNLPGNQLLKELYVDITNAIREVDTNHIIFIEGNWFANDFTGLTPPWDDNMVYSFHKYWSFNDQASIQWVLNMRDRHNVPLWCGEAGENSNTWFTDAIALLERHNIGWAWWPWKKIEEIDGPLSIPKSEGYDRLLDYWNGTATKPSRQFAVNALMQLAENLKLQNCIYQKDVIDAMFRQVRTKTLLPFVRHELPGRIDATDYDLGPHRSAYSDDVVATYHVSNDNYTSWNNGWAYRNDGVDIESCSDSGSNGYNVGWISDREWLTYTVHIGASGTYDVNYRVASANSGGRATLQLVSNGNSSTLHSVQFPGTGGWQSWRTVSEPAVLPAGEHRLRFFVNQGGFNLNRIEFDFITSVDTEKPIAGEFQLAPNYPNPFNPATTLKFSLANAEHVTLNIFNLRGELIETVVDEKRPAGVFSVEWNAADLPSGLYFCVLNAGAFQQTRKLLLQK